MRIFRFIAAKRAEHSIQIMCRVLEVSRSGFHAWERRAPSARAVADQALTERIAQIHGGSRKTYGSPRVHAELRLEDNICVGKKRVERLMRRVGLSGQVKRRRGKTTIRVQGVRTAPDLVERDFNPTEPNRLWAADITYIRTWEGWLYLASVMDLYSRRIVGWAPTTSAPSSSSTRSSWPSRAVAPTPGWCITPTRARSPDSIGRRNARARGS